MKLYPIYFSPKQSVTIMKCMKKTIAVICYFITLTMFAEELIFLSDAKYIKTATQPQILDKHIVFTLPSDIGTDIVLRGSFDNWESNHYYRRNINGIYYAIIERNVDEERNLFKRSKKLVYYYKIMVDQLWITDPTNENIIYDNDNIILNFVELIKKEKSQIQSPIQESDNYISFYYQSAEARHVSLAGNFNNYNPFNLPMQKIDQNIWHIKIYLKKGTYLYYFFVDGKILTDPLNQESTFDGRRYKYSIIKNF